MIPLSVFQALDNNIIINQMSIGYCSINFKYLIIEIVKNLEFENRYTGFSIKL